MQEEQRLQEETIDIKALILRYSQYWYYFILAIFFFFFMAFLNNRYTVPEYSVSTTLLIRDDNNTQMGAENLLEGLEIFSGKKNVKNEIIILSSYSLSRKIVKELELGISYFQHGFIISNELFKTAPFKINVDSSHVQLTGVDFFIKFIDDSTFEIEITTEDQYPYNINTEKFDKTLISNLSIKQSYSFNSNISSDYFSFSVSKTNYFNL